MDKEGYKKIEVECAVCKTKFDIWISNTYFTPKAEEVIRNNFYRYCPVCKALEEVKNKESV